MDADTIVGALIVIGCVLVFRRVFAEEEGQ